MHRTNIYIFTFIIFLILCVCFQLLEYIPYMRGESLKNVGFSYWGGGDSFPYSVKIQSNFTRDILKLLIYGIGIISIGDAILKKIIRNRS